MKLPLTSQNEQVHLGQSNLRLLRVFFFLLLLFPTIVKAEIGISPDKINLSETQEFIIINSESKKIKYEIESILITTPNKGTINKSSTQTINIQPYNLEKETYIRISLITKDNIKQTIALKVLPYNLTEQESIQLYKINHTNKTNSIPTFIFPIIIIIISLLYYIFSKKYNSCHSCHKSPLDLYISKLHTHWVKPVKLVLRPNEIKRESKEVKNDKTN